MLCKANVAVCSDVSTKHSTQSERHVEFLNVKPWRYVKKPLGVKRLRLATYVSFAYNINYSNIQILHKWNSIITLDNKTFILHRHLLTK